MQAILALKVRHQWHYKIAGAQTWIQLFDYNIEMLYILTFQVLSMFSTKVLSTFLHFWGHIPVYFWTCTGQIQISRCSRFPGSTRNPVTSCWYAVTWCTFCLLQCGGDERGTKLCACIPYMLYYGSKPAMAMPHFFSQYSRSDKDLQWQVHFILSVFFFCVRTKCPVFPDMMQYFCIKAGRSKRLTLAWYCSYMKYSLKIYA